MELLKEIFKYIKNESRRYINNTRMIDIILIVVIIISIILVKSNNPSQNIDNLNNSITMLSQQIDDLEILINSIQCDMNTAHDIIINSDTTPIYTKPYMKMDKDHIKVGVDIMNRSGIDPLVLFSIIDNRSKGNLFTYISDPTLRGYGMMTENTSRWIYEDIMGRKNYSHDMQNDGIKSIEILAEYISYLMKIHNGNIQEITYSYIGSKNDSLYNSMKEYIEEFNGNISLIEYNYINKEELINE